MSEAKLMIVDVNGKSRAVLVNDRPGSILSRLPDEFGYYYGNLPNDGRQINIRHEQDGMLRWMRWRAYVAGCRVPGSWATLHEAEAAAIFWLQGEEAPHDES